MKYLTLYAFSTENWGRPAGEVSALMELFCRSVVNETPELKRQGVRIAMIGDRSRFPEKVRSYLARAERETAGGERLTLILALNYSSRSEIVRAVRRIAAVRRRGRSHPGEIGEETLSAALDTAPWPDPDLVVRTQRRAAAEQFPPVAVLLCRTVVPRGAVARFHGGGFRPGDGGVCAARQAFRAG